MAKKVIVLIDGQNLFYSLRNMYLKESEIKWNDFFKSLIEPTDELIRTYWFRPLKIQDTHFGRDQIEKQLLYKGYKNHFDNFYKNPGLVPPNVLENIEAETNLICTWLEREKQKFSQIEYIYDQIALSFEDVEMVKRGLVRVNPYQQIYLGEKGVDISLAVKMIELSVNKRCEKIVLISGDYDYAEAIKFVKDNMTKVHIVKLHKGIPPKNKNMSHDLSVLADKIIDIYEADLKSGFVK